MIKILSLCLFIALPFLSDAQKIKKKYLGTYVGTMSTYVMDTGADLVSVGPTEISIELTKTGISMDVGRVQFSGNYQILYKNKTLWVLDVRIEGQIQAERITLYKKGKKMMREGVYPQPDTELKKI